MSQVVIEKVFSGYRVDGLALLQGRCHCHHGNDAAGADDRECCQTYSLVQKNGPVLSFFASGITSRSTDNYKFYYRVKKGGVEVQVLMYDSRAPKQFVFGGFYPPPLSAWQERGWQVLQEGEEPLSNPIATVPAWCCRADARDPLNPMPSPPISV